MNFKRSKLTQSVKYALALSLLSFPISSYAMTAEEADLNGDGQVNFLDFYEVIKRIGAVRGTSTYRAELDLDNNGTIQSQDYFLLFGNYRQNSSDLTTRLTGEVTDNQSPPNPIKGVRVELENTGIDTCTDALGQFSMELSSADFGENLVTFDGNGGDLSNGDPCVTEDATPGTLSGEYPVVPHKPIFINGNTDNVFRRMSLPERDLTGSTLVVADGTSAQATGNPNEFELLLPLEAGNDGANLAFESGCTIQFPDGENPRVSITQVDTAQLPVAPPPGQGSSLFVTFQPGGSSIDGCDTVEVVFDNIDMMANADDPNGADQPGLRGVFEGAFQEIIKVFAGDFVGDDFVNADSGVTTAPLLRGEIPVPFEFAWYAVTTPVAPCPTTTVTGHVLLNNIPMDPVANARVTMGGIGPVQTAADGKFTILNVPAGPNGARCLTNPFLLSAGASKDLNSDGFLTFGEIGGSPAMPAVPGGTTDLGNIKLGLTGVVQGEVMKLSRIDPWLTIPLPFTQMTLDPTAGDNILGQTDAFGNYRLENVPIGPFQLDANFDGDLPLPGGGIAPKVFDGFVFGDVFFNGQVVPIDFNFAGFADSIEVNVVEPGSNLPLQGLQVVLDAFGFDQGGFQSPSNFCFGQTDDQGQVIFEGDSQCFGNNDHIPMGPCELTISDFSQGGEFFVPQMIFTEEDGCFINEHGQVLVLDVEFEPPSLPGDIIQAQFNQGTANPGNGDPLVDIIVTRVTFTQPFFVDSFFDVFFQLDLDMDQNPLTGQNSGLNGNGPLPQPIDGPPTANNVIAQNIGADVRVICGDSLLIFDNQFNLQPFECVVVDANGDAIPGMEVPFDTTVAGGPFGESGDLILLIPKQPLIDFANGMPGGPFGDGPWDTVLEIGTSLDFDGFDGYGGLVFDIVPNIQFGQELPLVLDPNGNSSVDDPVGDFFFNEDFFID